MIVVTPIGHPPRIWTPTLAGAPPLRLPRRLAGTRMLVAAAHADDETLGAAGLIMSARRRGASVVLVIGTDGAAAFPQASPRERRQLADDRRQESIRAARLLGLTPGDVHHLELPDGTAEQHVDVLAARLADLGTGYDWWVAPWRGDPHPDHRAVGEAAARARPDGADLLEYPVWMRTGLTPKQLSPGSDLRVLRLHRGLRARKQQAIAAHTSQVAVYHPASEPVLPGHVLSHFRDGLEPFFITPGRSSVHWRPASDRPLPSATRTAPTTSARSSSRA